MHYIEAFLCVLSAKIYDKEGQSCKRVAQVGSNEAPKISFRSNVFLSGGNWFCEKKCFFSGSIKHILIILVFDFGIKSKWSCCFCCW